MRILCISILLLLLIIKSSIAQITCNQRFEQAQKSYYSGKLSDVEILLTGCLGSLTDNQQENAWRLIVLSKIFLKDQKGADSAMLGLLNVNPEYKIIGYDPPEFKMLIQSFKRSPVFSYGFKIGTNDGIYPVVNTPVAPSDTISVSITGRPEYYIGITGSWHIQPSFSLNTSLAVEKRTMNIKEEFASKSYVRGWEGQTRLEFPITATYFINNPVYKPFIEAGMAVNYLLRDYSRLDLFNSDNKNTGETNYSFIDYRNRFNYKIITGAGVLKKINGGYIGISIRYDIELLNPIKGGTIDKTSDIWLKYNYTDYGIKSSIFTLSIIYLKSIYHPKKINY